MNPPASHLASSGTTQEVQFLLNAYRQATLAPERDAALNALFERAQERLQTIASRMLGTALRVYVDSGDVHQGAVIRQLRALQDVDVLTRLQTACDFFRLASCQIRRELADLAKKYGNHAVHPLARPNAPDASSGPDNEHAVGTDDPARTVLWSEFHERAEELQGRPGEVFHLVYYLGLSYVEAADALGVNERTIRRDWTAARLQLEDWLGGLPFE